ncbi:hypothetical protein MRX96_013870 [Rhipicephalus microplus]
MLLAVLLYAAFATATAHNTFVCLPKPVKFDTCTSIRLLSPCQTDQDCDTRVCCKDCDGRRRDEESPRRNNARRRYKNRGGRRRRRLDAADPESPVMDGPGLDDAGQPAHEYFDVRK